MRIKRIDDRNIGREHNELAEVGRRLRSDGEEALAIQYFDRARQAQEVYVHLDGIGNEARSSADAVPSFECGIGLANWLMNAGWTPPEWLPILDQPHPVTLDDDDNFYF